MKFIKLFIFSLIFILVHAFFSPLSASAYGEYEDGYYTWTKEGFPSTPYFEPFSSPIVNNDFFVPDGYRLVAYVLDAGYTSPSYPFTAIYIYSADSEPFYFNYENNLFHFGNNNSLFCIENNIDSSGNRTFRRNSSPTGYFGSIRLVKAMFFVDLIDSNNNIIRPESSISFTLNTAIYGNRLLFNSQLNSGDDSVTGVDYYFFPASVAITGGGTTNIVLSTPSTELTVEQKESFLSRGFNFVTYGLDDLINDISSPNASLSLSSSSRAVSSFNPSSFGVSYEKIGRSPLFSYDSTFITTSGNIDLRDIISSHTGVYSYDALKLVAVVNYAGRYFIATFDFNPSLIVGGSPVAPSSIQGSVNFPTFSDSNSEFKELADYLKDLFNTNQENLTRNNNNLLAMLGAMPWSEYVGTGFGSQLPQLSMYLDSLFTDLFDNLTTPSQEDIDSLYADIQAEKADLKSKLAFVSDVKTEIYFIIATITADNNSVPPNFQVTLPSVLFGGHSSVTVNILSYELATPYIVGIIKDIITVFLSLSLVVYVWKTLPSTIGNMPRGDD